jgi:hypothetical protein
MMFSVPTLPSKRLESGVFRRHKILPPRALIWLKKCVESSHWGEQVNLVRRLPEQTSYTVSVIIDLANYVCQGLTLTSALEYDW